MACYQPRAEQPGDEGDPDMGTCCQCGEFRLTFGRATCQSCEDDIERGFDPDDDYQEPTGSCEWCGTNLYEDDNWDGLCNQCAWRARQ